jgi:hypothetical protein
MPFDLAELDTLTCSEAGVPMALINLRTRAPLFDDDGTALTISLAGRHSEMFRDMLKLIQTRRGELRNRGQEADGEAKEREDVDLLIACTRDWTLKVLDKQPFGCTPANITKLWNDDRFRPLREQAMAFILTDGNFLAPMSSGSGALPATTSSSTARSRPGEPSLIHSKATA